MSPKGVVFPLSGLEISTEHLTLAQVSTPPRFWYNELDRAWAPATKATKERDTRMTVNWESVVRRCRM